ncbi:MAG: hypothetical protein A2X94_02935 [Bdellovibrionales bacterium GWB1_55_8]|nr:MAG: hypothetical protein A2X94_02935 [Bdellovibrionales bacterium GWB1_55_8]
MAPSGPLHALTPEPSKCLKAIHSLCDPVLNANTIANPKSRKKYKYLNFANALIRGRIAHNTPFVRVIPTDLCNLKCSYCFQRSDDPFQMSKEQFSAYLKKAKEHHIGMMTFLGGEPMIWPHLDYAIAEATRANVITDITTNGTRLNAESVDRLGRAGLDFLNISVDGLTTTEVSSKTSVVVKKELLDHLKKAKEKYGMQFRVNSVIHKNNFEEIKQLIEFSKEHEVPISLGYVVPHSHGDHIADPAMYFTKDDTAQLNEIISHIIAKKRAGYPIIDPEEYFTGMHKFLKRENFWSCNYPTRYGWVNITPRGEIRSCTKKMDVMPGFTFLGLTQTKIKALKETLEPMVKTCNKNCYSNCAFDSYFYRTHKVEAMKKLLGIR